MDGTRPRTRQSALKDDEDGTAEGPKRKANFQENTSPVAKRTRHKKTYNSSSESGPEDRKPKDDFGHINNMEPETIRIMDAFTKLKEENRKLHIELEATKVEFFKVQEENTKNINLETELSNAHSKIETIMNDAHNKIVNLEKELCAAQEELDNMAAVRTENSHRHAMQQELNDACVEIDKLKAENVCLCEDLEKLRKENHVAERTGLMKALTHACSELDKARIQIADLQSSRSPSVNSYTEEEVTTLREEVKKLQVEIAHKNGLHLALTHACAELDRSRGENAKLSAQIAVLKKVGLQDSGEDPLDLSNKSHGGNTYEQGSQDEINKLRAEIIQLRAAPPMVVTVAASPSPASPPDYAHTEINRLRNELAELQDYKNEREQIREEMDELRQENTKMAGLQVALSHACTEVDKLRDEIQQEKSFSSAMHAQINKQRELEKGLLDANGKLEKLRMENALKNSLEQQLKGAFSEIEKLRNSNAERNRLEINLIAARTEVDKLKLDLVQAKAGILIKENGSN